MGILIVYKILLGNESLDSAITDLIGWSIEKAFETYLDTLEEELDN